MKIVITGGPSSGKTTMIDALQSKGYAVVNETAREIIIEKNYSKHLDRHPGEALDLCHDIYERQLEKESKINDLEGLIFLDRGYIDTQAYCEHLIGYVPDEIKSIKTNPYDAIILLERLPFVDDGLRRETEEQAQKIHDMIIRAYRNNGYDPISVPAMDLDDRINRVLEITHDLAKRQEISNGLVYKPEEV